MKELKFIGIGGAYALSLGNNCAYLKEKQKLLLLDCCECATEKLNKIGALKNVKEIYFAFTHMHADHISGLGTFIWYCKFILNIKPKILINSATFKNNLIQLLTLLGVDKNYYEFIKTDDFIFNNLKLSFKKTTHTNILECYSIMFEDKLGKYFYTGDTNDFEKIKVLNNDNSIKKIYTEVSNDGYGVHIKYKDLLKIKSDKLILMHFEDEKLLKQAKKDGFNIANFVIKEK